ncbi:MAG: response regulator [Verrucomicrobia bacterium]|nr:response regulator [Verrucomicrobiota bacterium]
MKTVLVIARQAGFADAIRAVLDPEQCCVIHQPEALPAEPVLSTGAVDACILDAELTDIQPLRVIEQLRRAAPQLPVIVYASARRREWEEDAMLLGVSHILNKPVRGRMLATLLDRCWSAQLTMPFALTPAAAPAPAESAAPAKDTNQTLGALRKFSGILTHSLDTGALLKEFLLLLREVLGVNRAAIFLRPPTAPLSRGLSPADRTLRSACALGLQPTLIDHFELSLDRGIGASVFGQGRILRSGGPEAAANREIQHEFDLLGVQVAVPLLDRESLLGVTVFDGRVTGEPFTSEELALTFHLLEELGLAIKNSRLHDERTAQHEMMTDTFDQLGSGCIVVGTDTSILLANGAARALFVRDGAAAKFEFTDIPQALGSRIFEVIQNGVAPEPFHWRPPASGGSAVEIIFRVTLRPFHRAAAPKPDAVLLLIEDITHAERVHQMEVESANLRLVRNMAEHLAHEIGNAAVPLATSQQLLSEDASAKAAADVAPVMAESVRRIARLAGQMRFLAQDGLRHVENVGLAQVLEEAFRDAYAQNPKGAAKLHYLSGGEQLTLAGEHSGLRHALAEILLNATQSTPGDEPVEVTHEIETRPDGTRWVRIEIRDRGAGFTGESARRATEPFFSTRTVGLGLGLTVSGKIIELHRGKLEITPPKKGAASTVRVTLPLAKAEAGK